MHIFGTGQTATAWRGYAVTSERYSQAIVAAASAVISATS
jgi:hypothetical protein